MLIKGNNINIDELVNKIDFDSYLSKDNNKGILLNDYEIEVLRRNGFNYEDYSSLSELIFDLDNYLNNGNDDEELEYITDRLSELHYYNETNK